jgi:nucleoside-diphosphate-sugar epimerase
MDITALVVGATGIAGRGVSQELVDFGAQVHGLSRKPEGVVGGVAHVSADLLDTDCVKRAVAGLNPTHVYFTAWSRRSTEAENIKVNAGLVRTLLDAVAPAKSIKHVALVTGLKHYLGPFSTPMRGAARRPRRRFVKSNPGSTFPISTTTRKMKFTLPPGARASPGAFTARIRSSARRSATP